MSVSWFALHTSQETLPVRVLGFHARFHAACPRSRVPFSRLRRFRVPVFAPNARFLPIRFFDARDTRLSTVGS